DCRDGKNCARLSRSTSTRSLPLILSAIRPEFTRRGGPKDSKKLRFEFALAFFVSFVGKNLMITIATSKHRVARKVDRRRNPAFQPKREELAKSSNRITPAATCS